MDRQLVTLYALDRSRAEAALPDLARALGGGTVGTLDAAGLIEVEVTAPTREVALERLRDAIASIGAEERFTFPATTGSEHAPPGRRAAASEDQPPDEPPHLQGGSPHEDRPEP